MISEQEGQDCEDLTFHFDTEFNRIALFARSGALAVVAVWLFAGSKRNSEKNLHGLKELWLNHLFVRIWAREGLSIRDRRLVTIALLAAQRRPDQLRDHTRGTRLGEDRLSEEEVQELMVHVADYAGWASGTNGRSIARAVFSELGP